MAARFLCISFLLILVSSLCLKARAESSGSVVFFDGAGAGASHRYLRNQPLDAEVRKSMSAPEVAAVVSVLLGFAPPSSLPADSFSKLNEVLVPNPFDRPHSVFLLEVVGTDDTDYSKSGTGTISKSEVFGLSKAEIQLPGEEEVFVVRVEESLEEECNAACIDKELANLASLLGGSYSGSIQSTDGKLSLPLSSGSVLNLHVNKEAELQFALSLISVMRAVNRGIEYHHDFSASISAELIIGRFSGFKALEEEYGSGEIVQQAKEIFHTTLSKLFDLLHKSYEGEIVGVVLYNKEPIIEVSSLTRVTRWLGEEVNTSDNSTTISEVLLVRKSLAWITGIILLVSTLIGVCMLMNMPLTRDTLLYSNVKLD